MDSTPIPSRRFDIVIIGSGVAGVYTALCAPDSLSIALITKESVEISNSSLAQGGIAVSLGDNDSPELHLRDTLYAGAGLCDEDAVRVLVEEARPVIEDIRIRGVDFDRGAGTQLSLGREGAHSQPRIVHAGDTTGKEVCDKLTALLLRRPGVTVLERTMALDLLVSDGTCRGLTVLDEPTGTIRPILADRVVCATGGYGRLYAHTTNPEVATGDGASLAYRAGAALMDLEFIQFHPTVLWHPRNRTFLISEAVRGEGAVLRNLSGERFMTAYHPMADLAPRDVVARAIFAEMHRTGTPHVWLDITSVDRNRLESRFPNIFRTCLGYGIDMSRDPIPVTPAEHYCMGGIRTDLAGQTGIRGFFACGEAACNGIHGANRLPSNSLLEGLVFGRRIGEEFRDLALRKAASPEPAGSEADAGGAYAPASPDTAASSAGRSHPPLPPLPPLPPDETAALRHEIQALMSDRVGIVRNASGLGAARDRLDGIRARLAGFRPSGIGGHELWNMALLARLVVASALERQESRGAHYRDDFPDTDDIRWKRHLLQERKDTHP